jgi:2-methylisocitrate lyase-like PEP mutase family enzyme
MVKKVEPAVDKDFVLVARTDARAILGLDEAMSREKAYLKAGADVAFAEAPSSVDELKKIADSLAAPLLVNMVEEGMTPLVKAKELQEMGYKIAIYANAALRVAAYAIKEAMAVLRRNGSTEEITGKMLKWQERQELVDLPLYQELEGSHYGRD